ncbi:hypothetical protein B0T18DRAFT_158865 [Schizothecium vesticola]|uniref:Uncharacterized protein n=1 Tax=Schizothecium vesticola TaxID=314040 RepID=A0AA40EWE3_9PEZI|nr:hypothetical protein B0T18DRAFT_158865 [Schizothecium vesticola]
MLPERSLPPTALPPPPPPSSSAKAGSHLITWVSRARMFFRDPDFAAFRQLPMRDMAPQVVIPTPVQAVGRPSNPHDGQDCQATQTLLSQVSSHRPPTDTLEAVMLYLHDLASVPSLTMIKPPWSVSPSPEPSAMEDARNVPSQSARLQIILGDISLHRGQEGVYPIFSVSAPSVSFKLADAQESFAPNKTAPSFVDELSPKRFSNRFWTCNRACVSTSTRTTTRLPLSICAHSLHRRPAPIYQRAHT